MKDNATPLMRQYNRIKSKYSNAILLFRMGDFYETFQEDAVIASKVLGIALTSRGTEGKAASIPLAGFPHHSLESYLYKFIKAGYRVAICEQVEDPAKARGIVKREVVEVVSPGTAVSDRLLDQKANNYLISMIEESGRVGLAVADVSTGEFYLQELLLPQLEENLR
ncbi:MAG: DNA mismatch repair protein MutS, partial [Fidelibacterota bacterium]